METLAYNCAIKCIKDQKEKEDLNDIWKDSPFIDICNLESNNVGEVGETFLEDICKKTGIPSNINGTKTKQKGGGSGDGPIKNKTNEIKTSRLGVGKNYQHELGEFPWKAEYMSFIDFSPDCIYLTIFKNWGEEFYKSSGSDKTKKCEPYFPTKSITQRKGNFNFKLDTTPGINEENVKKGFAIKITQDTNLMVIKEYIDKIIT